MCVVTVNYINYHKFVSLIVIIVFVNFKQRYRKRETYFRSMLIFCTNSENMFIFGLRLFK